jgi:hypothetical protein
MIITLRPYGISVYLAQVLKRKLSVGSNANKNTSYSLVFQLQNYISSKQENKEEQAHGRQRDEGA